MYYAINIPELLLHVKKITHVSRDSSRRIQTLHCHRVRLGLVTKLLFQAHSAAWVNKPDAMSNSYSVTRGRWRNSGNASMQISIYITFTAAFINLKEPSHRKFMRCRESPWTVAIISFYYRSRLYSAYRYQAKRKISCPCRERNPGCLNL